MVKPRGLAVLPGPHFSAAHLTGLANMALDTAAFGVYCGSSYLMRTRAMAKPTKKKKPVKITVQINATVMGKLTEHIQDLGLRRDQYLSRVLRRELQILEEYPQNSEKVYAYLLKQASIAQNRNRYALSLDPDVVRGMGKLCDQKRLVRDSFLNRFFFYLAFGYYNDLEKKIVPSPLQEAWGLLYDPTFDARNPKLKEAGYDLYLGVLTKTRFESCFMDDEEHRAATTESSLVDL